MDHDIHDDGEQPQRGSPWRVPAALLAAAAIGMGGLGTGWALRSPDTVEVQVTRAPTAEELADACMPEVEAVADELATAQDRVASLERIAAEQQGHVAALEAKIARGAEAGSALRAELAATKAELAETREQLAAAEQEKERLLADLRHTEQVLEETQQELVVTREQRDDAREEALYNRWDDFLSDAQLEICDKGNRKKLGDCRSVVMAAIDTPERQDRFAHCIRSGQAAPSVHERIDDAELPQFSEMLNEEAREVRGWYVEFCDPTLPERTDAPLAEGRLPATRAVSG